jgi:PIN domain nuclease of toxin-antitoxin system
VGWNLRGGNLDGLELWIVRSGLQVRSSLLNPTQPQEHERSLRSRTPLPQTRLIAKRFWCIWELAWLATHDRLSITGTTEAFVEQIVSRTAIRPITAKIAVLANQLPTSYPRDSSDRLIGATALAEGIALITKDSKIQACKEIKTIW